MFCVFLFFGLRYLGEIVLNFFNFYSLKIFGDFVGIGFRGFFVFGFRFVFYVSLDVEFGFCINCYWDFISEYLEFLAIL